MRNLVEKTALCLSLIFSLIACCGDGNSTSEMIVGDWTQTSIEPSEEFKNQEWSVKFIDETSFEEHFVDSENSIDEIASGEYAINDNILTTTYNQGVVNGESYEEAAINYYYQIISLEKDMLKIAFLGDNDVDGENNIKSLTEASRIAATEDYISTITLEKQYNE